MSSHFVDKLQNEICFESVSNRVKTYVTRERNYMNSDFIILKWMTSSYTLILITCRGISRRGDNVTRVAIEPAANSLIFSAPGYKNIKNVLSVQNFINLLTSFYMQRIVCPHFLTLICLYIAEYTNRKELVAIAVT